MISSELALRKETQDDGDHLVNFRLRSVECDGLLIMVKDIGKVICSVKITYMCKVEPIFLGS